MDLRCNHLDTTGLSRSEEHVPDRAEQAMTMTSGDAKAPRPAHKPGVLALLVFQAGGVPVGRHSWEGQTSDLKVFPERAQAVVAALQKASSPRYLSADAQLSHEDNAPNHHTLGFLTRIPNTLGPVSQVIAPALAWDTWPRWDDHTRA
jgi:transposase